jgi:pimeloyl-ACP methyl ester carboxylesterase
VLNTGYVEAGSAGDPAVILMRVFPYDIHSYAEVAPLLSAQDYRVIVPYFRGYGTTGDRAPAISWPPLAASGRTAVRPWSR